MQPAHGTINHLLTWLINHYGYNKVIFIKDTIPILSAIFIGLFLGMIIMAYVLKDTRLTPSPELEHMSVVQITKNKRKKIFINVPEKDAGNISLITGTILYLNAVLVKFLPIKKIQFVDSKKTRITFCIFMILLLWLALFTIRVDFHAILPDGHGGYRIYEFKK